MPYSRLRKLKIIFFIQISIIFLTSCSKDEETILSELVDQNRYYNSEIFITQNLIIYGKWDYLYYSGGFTGYRFDPTYDYLEIVKYGIYGTVSNNQIGQIGKVIIVSQDSLQTIIEFDPDDIYGDNIFITQKMVEFRGNDTLILHDMVLDGFNYYFSRKR